MTKETFSKISEAANANEVWTLPIQIQTAMQWVKDQAYLIVKKVRQYKKQKAKTGQSAKIYPFPNIHRDTRRVQTVMTLNGQTVAIDGSKNVVVPGDVENVVWLEANDAEAQALPIAVWQNGGFFWKLGLIKRPDVPKEVKNLVHELLVSKKRPRKIVWDPNTIETPLTLTPEQKSLLIQAIELNYLTDEQLVDLRFQLTISPFPIEKFREVHWKTERNRSYLLEYLRK